MEILFLYGKGFRVRVNARFVVALVTLLTVLLA
jgi:hypothetical protein